MAIGTKDLTVHATADSKRQKVQSLGLKHKPLFIKENVNIPKWNPRVVEEYKGEKVVKFLPQELYGGVDIYTEFCTANFIPTDHKRTLWKWVYNAHYAEEYELSEPHPANGNRFYYVNVEELINVTELHSPQPQKSEPIIEKEVKTETPIRTKEESKSKVETEDEIFQPLDLADSDLPYASMTMRDYAAITWKKPCSKKAWLNELITKTF